MRVKSADTKMANTSFNIHPLIKGRWSPRAFSHRMPPQEEILRLLEAARWAPSSYNEQPWRFIVGSKDNAENYNKVLQCLNESNRQWASNAPVLMLVCAKKHFSHSGKENRHYKYDCGAAMANLCLQASADDLYVHQMAGILPARAVELFHVPDEFEVITGVAVGYLGDADMLNEKHQRSERSERHRKQLQEISFTGSWGNGLPGI